MSYKLVWIKTHKDYLRLLKELKYRTEYVYLYVGCPLNDEHKDFVLEYCNNHLILIKTEKVDCLFGENAEINQHTQYIYSFENYDNREHFFEFLSTFETFFHRDCLLDKSEKYQNRCDFGLDDIGFVDKNGEVLCSTITHETMTYVNEKIRYSI